MSIKAYKGMDKGMKCRGFQYEPGGIYEADHAVRCGGPGFHACEIPLDVFGYYPPADSRFFEVEQDGELSRDNEDSKVASSILKVGAEIGIPGLVRAHVEWVKEQIQEEKTESNTGDWNGETYPLIGIKAAIVDGDTIKPDVWYTMKDGEFVEVKEDADD